MRANIKIVVLGILVVLLLVVGINMYMGSVAKDKEESIKTTIASIIVEELNPKMEFARVREVKDIVYTNTQGNNYIGSATVDFTAKQGEMSGELTSSGSVKFFMVCGGKSVQLAIQ